MNKKQIHEATGNTIARTAVNKNLAGAYSIVGKWCYIAPDGDEWDVWLCNPIDMENGLSERKLNAMLDRPEICRDARVDRMHRLKGEAHFRINDPMWIVENLAWLGIRKRRKADPAAADRMRAIAFAHHV